MRKGILSAALVLGLMSAGFAQQTPTSDQNGEKKHHKHHEGTDARENKTPEERAKFFTAALDKQLNLSEAQEKEIYNIQLENAKKMEAMHKQHQADGTQAEHKAPSKGMDKGRTAGMEQINSILTPEQRVTYQKLREERMKKYEEFRAQHQNGNSTGDSTQTRKNRTKK